jgi:hypothetical protein
VPAVEVLRKRLDRLEQASGYCRGETHTIYRPDIEPAEEAEARYVRETGKAIRPQDTVYHACWVKAGNGSAMS